MGQRVELRAAGILYRGVFVEMTDEDVKLRGETGWIILDVQRVTQIALESQKKAVLNPIKMVDHSFYASPDEDE